MGLAVLPPAIASCLRLISMTCRYEERNRCIFEEQKQLYGRAILAFWHEVLPLAMWAQRSTGYHTLTSYSFDGELAARVVRHFGLRALRGSSSRGGSEALRQLELALRMNITVGFTLDGPKGPRRESKPGIAILAGRAKLPVIPFMLASTNGWRVNSWDRMVIPKPFSRIIGWYGHPIAPPERIKSDEVERVRYEIEMALATQHKLLEQELGIDIG